jgi:hypothetical protein
MNELIEEILRNQGIDPEQEVVHPIDGSKQTAFEKLEAAVLGALDEIGE